MNDMTSQNTHHISKSLGLDRGTIKGKRGKRWAGIVVLLLMAATLVFFLKRPNGGALAVTFETKEAHKGDLTVKVTATGNLEPTNEIKVGIEVSGTVSSVEVDYNDRVKVGQVLAKLDVSKLEAQVMKSKSALESARTMVQKAEADAKKKKSDLDRLERVKELSGGKVPSQTELESAQAAYQTAAAEVASARAAVSEAEATLRVQETDLSKAVIRSPVNGIVMTREIEPGQTVAASFQAPTLFTLAEDLTKMELHVDVDEADVGKVKEGQKATFTVDAYPDRTFDAIVTSVRYSSQEVSGVITYETVLNVENDDLSLRPGMTATADIVVQEVKDALLVPNAALRFTPPADPKKRQEKSGGLVSSLMPRPPHFQASVNNGKKGSQQTVWVLRGTVPSPVDITVGMTDGSMTEVVSGEIKPGQGIIVDSREKRK